MPQNPFTIKKLTCAMLAVCTAGIVILGSVGLARAQDDDDEDVPYDTKIFRSIMSTLGFRRDGDGPNIDYRERSPLVVPPNLSLPPPETAPPAPNVANWPVDQDVKRRKEAIAARKKARMTRYQVEDEGRALSPQQLTPGAGTVDARSLPTPQAGRGSGPQREAGDRLSASEIGDKGGLFSWNSLFGSKNNDVAKFQAEPPRLSLTDPPAGYLTPSPAQPYGLTPESKKPKAMDLYDRQTPVEDRKQ